MKHLTHLMALLLIAAAHGSALAQESPANLVKKLSSGSYTEREKAARALEKLGRAALAALSDGTDHADLETRRRALILIERIEDNILKSQVLAATPMRLQFENSAVSNAVGKVATQTGLRLGSVPGMERTMSVETGELPYWQAWRRFRDAAKLTESDWATSAAKLKRLDEADGRQVMANFGRIAEPWHPKFSTPRLEFAAKPADAYAEDDRSSVRVRVKWHALDKTLDGKQTHAIFAVELRPEPRLEIASLPRVEITKIVDADGKMKNVQAMKLVPFTSDSRDAAFLAAYAGEIQFGGLLHLKAIPWQDPVRPLKELHGRVRMEAVVRAILLETPAGIKAGKAVRGIDGVTLKVLEADTTDDGQLYVRIHLDHLDSLAPQTDEQKIVRVRPGLLAVRGAIDVALDRLELRDAKDFAYRPAKTEYQHIDKGRYEATIYFAAPPVRVEDLRLMLTKPARTVTVDLPFTVTNIAAPK